MIYICIASCIVCMMQYTMIYYEDNIMYFQHDVKCISSLCVMFVMNDYCNTGSISVCMPKFTLPYQDK